MQKHSVFIRDSPQRFYLINASEVGSANCGSNHERNKPILSITPYDFLRFLYIYAAEIIDRELRYSLVSKPCNMGTLIE